MTEQEAMKLITPWLQRWKMKEAAGALFLCAISLALAAVVLFCTFWFAYAILVVSLWGVSAGSELFFNHRIALAHEWRLLCCGAFLVLVFVENARANPDQLGDYPKDDYRPVPALGISSGIVSLLILLRYRQAGSQMIRQMLFAGPRLAAAGWAYWLRFLRLERLHSEYCARALASPAAREHAVPLAELAGKVPAAEGPYLLANLMLIEGVVPLGGDAPRIGITDSLRADMLSANE